MAAITKKRFWQLNNSLKLDLLIKDQQKIGKAQDFSHQVGAIITGFSFQNLNGHL